MSNGGYRPGSGRKLEPRTARILGAIAAGHKPAAVAAEFDVSIFTVYAACKYHNLDCTLWRSHQVQSTGEAK